MNAATIGGTDDFMCVRHLVLRGRQFDIGRALALEVQAAGFPQAPPPADPLVNRARRLWFERNWPQYSSRRAGIADAFGIDALDDAGLPELSAVPFAAGCSAIWCSPSSSSDGHARIARNFDFMTGSVLDVAGMPSDPPQPPMMSRPYVIEMYPDDGHASVTVAGGDLSGCFDGINDAGLAVVLFADDETEGLRPTHQVQAGIHELQLPRLLLDMCATVDEAIEVLYGAKQYDNFIACHYLVADARGDAFVWERDTHNAEHVVRAVETPLCVTNHLLHRYEQGSALPVDRPGSNTYERAQVLEACARSAPLSVADLRAALRSVRVEGPDPIARTLWSSVFDLDERSLTVEFYLGETADGGQRRSDPLVCCLSASLA
jgi:hypothetical protein